MVLTLDELKNISKATILCSDRTKLESILPTLEINFLLFDSRRLNEAKRTAFFAIKTEYNDGHRYIDELYDNGVRVFICQTTPKEIRSNAYYLLVEDTLKALQEVGAFVRKQFKGNVIAISGSNGKTIVKEWTRTLIADDKKVCFSPRSYNSQIGVAISLWQLNNNFETGIFEAGISKPNEMQALHNMIQPNIGLFTNIGDAHGVNFSSIEEKINEKLQLFKGCKKLLCSQDNPTLFEKVSTFCKENNIELLSYQSEKIAKELHLTFEDKASIENAVSAIMLSKQIGISEEKIKQRLPLLSALDMRLQIKQSAGGSILINDSYSLDITSLEVALDFLNTQDKKLQRCVILSDLQEKSEDTKATMEKINTLLKNKGISNLYGIGTDFVNNETIFEIEHHCFETINDFLAKSQTKDFYNKAILLKGSRKAELEKISNLLELQNHQSILKVNLTALEENIKYFKSKLQPNTLLMGMVKASSYGCGGSEIARELQFSLANYLTVAFADEGVTLRNNGITLPIMVVTPETDALNKMIDYNLEPVVHNFDTLELVKELPLRIHLKLDTGMHRLGFEANKLPQLIETLKQHNNLHIASVFSHLSCADSPEHDNYTLEQIKQFEQLANQITNSFNYKILTHICNSAATIRFPQAHFDMVRLGIGMYGIGCDEHTQKHLRYVQSLETRLTEIRTIESGESVSYMRNFVAQEPTKIGVIPIGYADGLNRHLSKQNFSVWINGSKAPIVGNICMDMCMINLNGINAKTGDRVVIFGEENPIENMAQALDTISYEIFTSISPRIKRIYYHE